MELDQPNPQRNSHGKLKLRVFSSFEEAAEADAVDASHRTPEQRIRDTVELILRVYGVTREQIKNRNKKLRINFQAQR